MVYIILMKAFKKRITKELYVQNCLKSKKDSWEDQRQFGADIWYLILDLDQILYKF